MELQRTGGRPEAAAAIWSWQEEIAPRVEELPAKARLRGTLRALVAGVIGALLLLLWSRTVGAVVLGIAGVILASALFSPLGLYSTLERFFAALGRATGRALAWVLLPPIFYFFFLPFGRLLRRGQRDRMKRFYERETPSYWEPREARGADSRRRLY